MRVRFASFEPLAEFYEEHVRRFIGRSAATKVEGAIDHLRSHFGRPPEINDLTSALDSVKGFRDSTALRDAFRLLATRAADCGKLYPLPQFPYADPFPMRQVATAAVSHPRHSPPQASDCYALSVPPGESLMLFFETTHAVRLSEKSAEKYRGTLRKMKSFSALEPAFGMLNRDWSDRFANWLRERGLNSESHSRRLRTLWRFSWRERKTDNVPPGTHHRRPVTARPADLLTLAVPEANSLLRFFETTYVSIRRCRPGTADSYLATLRKLREFASVEATFGMLNEDFTDRFTVWLSELGLKPGAVNKHLRNLLALWRFAWRKRKVAELPRDVSLLRSPKRTPECWSTEELKRLLKSAAVEQGIVGAAPAHLFWTALLSFLFATGLRIGAVRDLRRDAIDLESGWVAVPAESQKQFADQTIRLSAEVNGIMGQLLEYPGDKLFQTDFAGPEVWRRRLRTILKRAGLSYGRRDLFHKLRRSCATYIARELGEQAAQQYLGHSSIQVTRSYIDPRKMNRPQAADVLPRITFSDPIV